MSPTRPRAGAAPLLPPALHAGVRWLATATAALLVASIAVGLRGPDGPRPVPLVLAGLAITALGLGLERRTGRGRPLPSTLVVIGTLTLLLAGEAFLDLSLAEADLFLLSTGGAFIGLGLLRDDRRPAVVGSLQLATAVGRPTGATWHHCLVARDLQIPLPRLEPVAVLGLTLLLVAVLLRQRAWRGDAGRGLETVGLALFLGALAAKALELPGHRAMCGTGDAVDGGWALLFLVFATSIGLLGVVLDDRVWAGSGLAGVTLFSLAALALEANPLWGLLVGVPMLATLVLLDRAGTPWPRQNEASLSNGPPKDDQSNS